MSIITRFIKFTCTSTIGASADMGVLWLLNRFVFNGYVGEYIIAPVISFECSVIVGFTASYFLIWHDRITERSTSSYFRHLAAFNASCIGVFLVKMVLLLIIQRIFGWSAVICNIIARAVSGLLNFVMGEKVIFRRKNP